MFGYVVANHDDLTPQQMERYRGAYCGLCKTLGQRHGFFSRMSLTYDMTFLLLFLGALYEPEETTEAFRCPIHPKQRRQAVYVTEVAFLQAAQGAVGTYAVDEFVQAGL